MQSPVLVELSHLPVSAPHDLPEQLQLQSIAAPIHPKIHHF